MLSNSTEIFAQYHWGKQESGTTSNLRGLWFTDSSTGWACGDSGIILHTSDKGTNWLRQTSGVNVVLEDIFFRDSINGWICGDSGTILHTNDGGATWGRKTTPVYSLLHRIQFMTPEQGIASGLKSTVVYGEDSGNAWIPQVGSDSGSASITFNWIDNYRAEYAFSDTQQVTLIHTIDRGRTWIALHFPPIYNPPLYINDIASYKTRIASNQLIINNWDVCSNGDVLWVTMPENAPLQAVIRANNTGDTLALHAITVAVKPEISLQLWSVGNKGKIVTSNDSGITWETISSGVITTLREVAFPAYNLGWVVGDSGVILNYTKTTGILENRNEQIPSEARLCDPYPNPFNPSCVIGYEIPEYALVRLTLHDILGKELMVLEDKKQLAGSYSVQVNAVSLPSGVYYVRLLTDKNASVKKILLMK